MEVEIRKRAKTKNLPNGQAPKVDGAQACDRDSIVVLTRCNNEEEGIWDLL